MNKIMAIMSVFALSIGLNTHPTKYKPHSVQLNSIERVTLHKAIWEPKDEDWDYDFLPHDFISINYPDGTEVIIRDDGATDGDKMIFNFDGTITILKSNGSMKHINKTAAAECVEKWEGARQEARTRYSYYKEGVLAQIRQKKSKKIIMSITNYLKEYNKY